MWRVFLFVFLLDEFLVFFYANKRSTLICMKAFIIVLLVAICALALLTIRDIQKRWAAVVHIPDEATPVRVDFLPLPMLDVLSTSSFRTLTGLNKKDTKNEKITEEKSQQKIPALPEKTTSVPAEKNLPQNTEESEPAPDQKNPDALIPPSETKRIAVPKHIRALWVWSESAEIVNNSDRQDEFFSFARAPHGNEAARINRIFLNGDSFDFLNTAQTARLRAFLVRAHAAGMSIEFLTGKSTWTLPGQAVEAMSHVDRMIAFNTNSAQAAERFDGLHFDIEPYVLAEWKTNSSAGSDAYNDEIEKNYVAIFVQAKQKILASGQTLTVSADMPAWFAKASDIWRVMTDTASPVDYITVMNYFDTEEKFLYGYGEGSLAGGIGPVLKNCGAVPVVFAAETKKLSDTALSFYEEGYVSLASVMDRAHAAYASDPHFAGTAVHHYRTFKELTQ